MSQKTNTKECRQQYYQENKDQIKASVKEYYLNNKEKVRAYNKIYQKAYAEENADVISEKKQSLRAKLKAEIMSHYSGGTVSCTCGYNDIRALSIDHIEGGGTQHRKEIASGGLYRWLKKNGFPEGYQVLCMNCQFIKRYENNEHAKLSREEGQRRRALGQLNKRTGDSKYQGITKERDKFLVRISKGGKTVRLGLFEASEIVEAAKNYDYHALNVWGRELCYLNFPDFDYAGFTPRVVVDYDPAEQSATSIFQPPSTQTTTT
jgi:hypothetical protein